VPASGERRTRPPLPKRNAMILTADAMNRLPTVGACGLLAAPSGSNPMLSAQAFPPPPSGVVMLLPPAVLIKIAARRVQLFVPARRRSTRPSFGV